MPVFLDVKKLTDAGCKKQRDIQTGGALTCYADRW